VLVELAAVAQDRGPLAVGDRAGVHPHGDPLVRHPGEVEQPPLLAVAEAAACTPA
jgi:hypothetical protein